MKLRLDKLLVERGLSATRTRAQERISSGQVYVAGAAVTKAGFLVDADQAIEVRGDDLPYVSRGGLKLAAALDHWKIDLSGRVCLDIGISTGGFTDCMLQRGASRIIGVDCGHDQLAVTLQVNPCVQLLEQTNARYLTPSMLPSGISFVAMDVSFVASSLVLPAVIASAFPSLPSTRNDAVSSFTCEAVILVKPQFEAGREFVGRQGIVKSEAAHRHAIERVRESVSRCGAQRTDIIDSPIVGGDGNREFLLYARF